MWVHLNGRLVGEDEARIPVFDRGFLYGDGVFESLRALGGRVFRADRHLERLSRSAGLIGLVDVPAPALLQRSIDDLLAANRLEDARIRITLTRGPGRPGEYVEASGPPTVVMTAARFAPLDEALYRDGVRVAIPGARRIPPESLDPSLKTISRLASVLARREAKTRGAFEAVFLDGRDRLTEGTVSNFFLVVDGRLLTCPMPDGGLPGITREAVLEIAAASTLPVEEIPLPLPMLAAAQEAFLTNTSWEVLPVVQVDHRTIGAGRPGPVSGDLLARYRKLMRNECGAGRIDGATVPA